MRISSLESDRGFLPIGHELRQSKILLDGVQLHGCITADEEQGFATCYLICNSEYVMAGVLHNRTKQDRGLLTRNFFGNIVIKTPQMQCDELVNKL